tara:strand:+ start:183 stop:365 length:183 start_codon:yes stop_codon:yes gene_type:complete
MCAPTAHPSEGKFPSTVEGYASGTPESVKFTRKFINGEAAFANVSGKLWLSECGFIIPRK